MYKKKCISLLMGIIVFSLIVSGGFFINSAVAKEQVFHYSSASAVIGLNPIINTTAPDNGLHQIILETVVKNVADENNQSVIKPAAAKSWDVSEDGRVYTFYIRENSIWNDGVPVTAHDFVYTFRKMASPKSGSTNAWLFDGVIQNFEEAHYDKGKTPEDIGVKAIDDKTLQFTLVKPFPYFLQLLDGAKPIRKDKYEEWGDAYGSSVDKIVTNGPFVVVDWNQNVKMTLKKNKKYWDSENVKLDRLERKVIQNPGTAAQSLLSGEIDVLSTNKPNWQQLFEKDGRFRKIVTPGNAPEFFGFNCDNKYFKNPKIRLAFSLSMDREKYVEDLQHGQAVPLYSLMPPVTKSGSKLYHKLVDGKNQIIKRLQDKYPDPKSLLIEGLKEEGFDLDPAKMKIEYATRGTSEYSKRSAEWLQQQWREKLGVEIIIDMMEWNIMWDKVDQGDYDIATAGWGPYYNDPNALLQIYDPYDGYFDSSKSGWTGSNAEKYHKLLKEASVTTNNKKRAELYLEAEELLVGTGVLVPTYVNTYSTFLFEDVHGYYINPHAYTDYTKIYKE